MTYIEKSLAWYNEFHNFISKNSEWNPLVEVLKINETPDPTILKLRENHYTATTRTFDRPGLLQLMIKAINQFEHQNLGLPSVDRLFDRETKRICDEVHEKGHAPLPQVDAKTVAEMKAYFESQKIPLADGTLVTLDEFEGANVAEFPASTVVRCPHLLRLASDPQLLSAVERYLGAIPTVIVLSAWWSLANKEAPKEAQYFHLDYDDYKFCKYFVYLTDVDMESGPHAYVDGTHRFDNVMKAREEFMSEVDVFDRFYISTLRKSDETVKKYFKKDTSYFTGPAGSTFLVDTRGIHKGLLPKSKRRLICQVTFGVSPAFQQKIEAVKLSELPPTEQTILSKEPNAYIFRLFVDAARQIAKERANTYEIKGNAKNGGEQAPVVLENIHNWSKPSQAEPFFKAIISEIALRQKVLDLVKTRAQTFDSLGNLVKFLKDIFTDAFPSSLSPFEKESLEDCVRKWKKQVDFTYDAYEVKTKPNPSAVFWPNPTRDPESSVYKTLPFVKNIPLVTRKTRISSAGSCFAFELSYGLQQRGFNYLVTEKGHRPEDGVFIDAYDPKVPYEKFSASWGILFNTPSFSQIAEYSFGLRDLPPLVVKQNGNGTDFYVDPFREGVFFSSIEAYQHDREQHRLASRQALEKAEVIVLTLGLNECWEVMGHDCVISRNPHSIGLASMLKHRILSVEENITHIEKFIKTTREFNPNIKFLISISPIPFIATGRSREMHVVEANTHSKSVLHVAAHEICKRFADTYYFPAFELVTSCTMDPFDIDQRHVKQDVVKRVISLFDAMFVDGSSQN